MTPVEDVDVLVVGAGVSGLDVAARLRRASPRRSLVVLEGRERIGGTWDLFRYPGVRSDTDLFTFAFPFRPWTGSRAIGGGETIRRYLVSTAEAEGLTGLIRFGCRVTSVAWSSAERRWSVTTSGAQGPSFRCRFVVLCTGYYRTDGGHLPDFPGQEAFAGRIVHPQHWPEDLDLAGSRVVVIGSGATAVSLVPAVARVAASTTMLQRTSSWVAALPSTDRFFGVLRRVLPVATASRAARLRWIATYTTLIAACRVAPHATAAAFRRNALRRLPAAVVEEHFTPSYRPWAQRLCLSPDGELFTTVRDGRAEVVTDRIDRFVEDGLLLASGRRLPADVVVAATGLRLETLGGITVTVDGARVDPSERLAYKGLMLDRVPNLAFVVGYAKSPWTLRADLAAQYLRRLLARLDRDDVVATPVASRRARRSVAGAVLELDAGYFRRDGHRLPRRGRAPWRVGATYPTEALRMRFGPLADRLRLDR